MADPHSARRRRVLKSAVASTSLLSLGVAYTGSARAAGIVGVRVWPAKDYTRVTIESDRALSTTQFTVEDPDRLVRLFHEPPQNAFPGIHRFSVSPANFYDWKRDAQMFEGMAIYRFRQLTLTGAGDAEAVVAGAVGADFFQVVRARPSLGRVFLADEDSPGRAHVVVLSNRFWQSHLGGAADVIGRTLSLDGEAYTIGGVMPARFSVASWAVSGKDIWVPLA